jgi:hypothetical protein
MHLVHGVSNPSESWNVPSVINSLRVWCCAHSKCHYFHTSTVLTSLAVDSHPCPWPACPRSTTQLSNALGRTRRSQVITCLGLRCWMTVDLPLLSRPTHNTLHCGLAKPIASSNCCSIPIRCVLEQTASFHLKLISLFEKVFWVFLFYPGPTRKLRPA